MCQNFSGDYLSAFYENFLFSSLYLFTFPKLFMVDLCIFLIVQNILRKMYITKVQHVHLIYWTTRQAEQKVHLRKYIWKNWQII